MKKQGLKIKCSVTGKETAVELRVSSYRDNDSVFVCLLAQKSEDYYSDVTVNLPGYLNPLPEKDCAYIHSCDFYLIQQ